MLHEYDELSLVSLISSDLLIVVNFPMCVCEQDQLLAGKCPVSQREWQLDR